MELWDSIMRRFGRRPTGGKAPNGGKFGDEYWFPARPNPWPWVGAAVAILMAVWAGIVWTDDGSGPAKPPETTGQPTQLAGSNGLTSRDLSGCLAFKASSADGAAILAQALAPEGETLAANGGLTEEIMDGYISGVDAVVDSFDDKRLTKLLVDLRADLVKQREEAKAKEAAGAAPWAALYPDVRKELRTFGSSFESRCEQGGIIIDVVPQS